MTTAQDEQEGTPGDLPGWVVAAGLVLVTLSGALSAALECLLVPTYLGATIFPITVVLAVVGNVLLPWLGYSLCRRTGAAAAPFAAWLVVVLGLGMITRPEGDVILPGGGPGHVEYVTYGLLLLGTIIGAVAVGWVSAPSRAAANRRPARTVEHVSR